MSQQKPKSISAVTFIRLNNFIILLFLRLFSTFFFPQRPIFQNKRVRNVYLYTDITFAPIPHKVHKKLIESDIIISDKESLI